MTAEEICVQVAERHGVQPSQLRRHAGKSFFKPRAEAMATIRRELHWSFPAIGKHFGGYNHSSVMYAIGRCDPDSRIPPKASRRKKSARRTKRDLENELDRLQGLVLKLERVLAAKIVCQFTE